MIHSDFFITKIPENAMSGVYNLKLAALSYLLAVFASYVALDMIGRLRSNTKTFSHKNMWLFGGAFAMGAGIWSVHFVGMLAYSMPDVPVGYELKYVILSMIPAFIGSFLALICLKNNKYFWRSILLGAIFLGTAIISMHYTEMGAMLGVKIGFKQKPFIASFFIGISLSAIALWLALVSNVIRVKLKIFVKIISALIMGADICAIHYLGLPGAAVFIPLSEADMQYNAFDPIEVAISVAVITITIMGIALIVSTYNRLMSSKLMKLYDALEEKSEKLHDLLRATFPVPIINELIKNNYVEPRLYKHVAVVFTDISDFTTYCSQHTPKEVFANMQEFIELCEKISSKFNLEKIKTIGDAYMAISGMFIKTENPVLDAVKFSLELLEKKKHLKTKWEIHIGIDYGDVMAGIVGSAKYLFDAWGDRVNTAARIQDIAKPDSVYVSKFAWETVKDKCHGKSLGMIDLKGKGLTELYEITSLK